jgi:hypothetical protein
MDFRNYIAPPLPRQDSSRHPAVTQRQRFYNWPRCLHRISCSHTPWSSMRSPVFPGLGEARLSPTISLKPMNPWSLTKSEGTATSLRSNKNSVDCYNEPLNRQKRQPQSR